MLQLTGVVDDRSMRAQYLDRMDIDMSAASPSKSQAVRLPFTADDGVTYVLNLIDTPGHVDFTYEVSGSLAACEGAVLLVDAAQGIEAQTLANLYLALRMICRSSPFSTRLTLPRRNRTSMRLELATIIGCEPDDVLRVSAKTGEGVNDLLNTVVSLIPPPVGDADPACASHLRLGLRRVSRCCHLRPDD